MASTGIFEIPGSFLIEQGWEFGNPEWRDRNRLSPEEQHAYAETQRPKLEVPIDIVVYKSGSIDFHDGHHRVFAAHTLGTKVRVNIERNALKPEVWAEYLDRIQKGYTYRDINPDGENLNRFGVPSEKALKAGRRAGLRNSALWNFYREFDAEHSLRTALTKLANENPALRRHLVPVLQKNA